MVMFLMLFLLMVLIGEYVLVKIWDSFEVNTDLIAFTKNVVEYVMNEFDFIDDWFDFKDNIQKDYKNNFEALVEILKEINIDSYVKTDDYDFDVHILKYLKKGKNMYEAIEDLQTVSCI